MCSGMCSGTVSRQVSRQVFRQCDQACVQAGVQACAQACVQACVQARVQACAQACVKAYMLRQSDRTCAQDICDIIINMHADMCSGRVFRHVSTQCVHTRDITNIGCHN